MFQFRSLSSLAQISPRIFCLHRLDPCLSFSHVYGYEFITAQFSCLGEDIQPAVRVESSLAPRGPLIFLRHSCFLYGGPVTRLSVSQLVCDGPRA